MDNIDILEKIKTLLVNNYGNIINKIILFGSRTDGTAREYSDYDILIIVNSFIDWRMKDELRSVIYDLNIEYDILLSVQIISVEDLETPVGKQSFIQNAIDTGIAV